MMENKKGDFPKEEIKEPVRDMPPLEEHKDIPLEPVHLDQPIQPDQPVQQIQLQLNIPQNDAQQIIASGLADNRGYNINIIGQKVVNYIYDFESNDNYDHICRFIAYTFVSSIEEKNTKINYSITFNIKHIIDSAIQAKILTIQYDNDLPPEVKHDIVTILGNGIYSTIINRINSLQFNLADAVKSIFNDTFQYDVNMIMYYDRNFYTLEFNPNLRPL